jgi:hypothetical protein
MLDRYLYDVACVVVPLLWGLVTYYVTRAIEKRRPPAPSTPGRKKDRDMPELEYYL